MGVAWVMAAVGEVVELCIPSPENAFLFYLLLFLFAFASFSGFVYLPFGIAFLIFVKLAYWCGHCLLNSLKVDESKQIVWKSEWMARSPLSALAGLVNITLGWLGQAAKHHFFAGGVLRNERHGMAERGETRFATFANGLACYLFALFFSHASLYHAWVASDVLAPIDTSSANRWGIVYGHALEPILTFRLNFEVMIPSWAEIQGVLDDLPTALESALQRAADIWNYVDFDPTYFLEGAKEAASLNIVLSFLRVIAVYGVKAFGALDLAKIMLVHREKDEKESGDGTVQFYECRPDVDKVN